MPASLNNASVAKASFALMLLPLVLAATPGAFAQDKFAQDRDKTFGDSFLPLVYPVENTGANFRAPQLPIVRSAPNHSPFAGPVPVLRRMARHLRSRAGSSRRNEIKAAVEKYELGPKPDCSDCTITATYTPPVAGSTNGSLTVLVTRNGKSLTLTSGIYIPQGMGSGPFPAMIPMEIGSFNFFGTDL